ncbi:hypothetical protein NLG97_g8448 [Lecanicillium saksenae]|uniref:Uncharacterized protein n=1 Tax=Lecanicillium saksenae TaxID=468837 RepID=A0ACC1QMR0_9HYPO|nr:hypothetical protein NLG97_g8448 [Lecanicillium saksenae]
MQMSLVLALGASKVAMASSMFQNGTAANASAMTMPETIGEFSLVGCAETSLANFKMVAKSEHMSLNLCAASCPSKFMVTHEDECHCGDEEPSDMSKKDAESCALACPGAASEICGGVSAALSRRGGSKICTVYVRSSKPTVETKIEYHVHTITACPPTVTDCPAAPSVTTITKTLTTEICPAPEWHKKKIVCYGPNCAPEYPCQGEDCKKERVICKGDNCWTEACKPGDEWSKKVIVVTENECKLSATTAKPRLQRR